MGLAHARISGAWVDSDQAGMVRYGGSWESFGPSGLAYEGLTWGTVPSNSNADDGSQAYNMGLDFSIATARNCVGVQWRVPDSTPNPPGGTHAISIWNFDTATRIAYKEFVPVPGDFRDILFDTPVALSTGVNYVAAVYTNHYSFRSGAPAGLTSPSGNIVAGTGRLAGYNSGASSAPMPLDPFSSTYYVCPLVATS